MPSGGVRPTPPGPAGAFNRPPQPSTRQAGMVARQLGPYRIDALLGRGGMSAVYRALQTTLDRPVALKLLPPEFAGDQTLVARFLQEARAAAALQHPHIIPIYDSGQVGGEYYIAMRYVEGVTLARAIPETGLPVQRALYIVEQIASALDYAHARGVVHRDVSAGNVMLEAGDRVTLMDFGIAQARQGSRLTRAGVAVGTLEYLSPEQARGEIATGQSDIYALGILTYELLSGKLPYSAADDRALLLQHLNAPPPSIRRLRPDVPLGIDAAIQRALAKDPMSRFLSAGAFVTALNTSLTESRRRTAAVPAPPRQQQSATPGRATPDVGAPKFATAAQGRPAHRVPTAPAAHSTLIRRRRIPIPVLALLVLLLLALAGGAYAQHVGGPRAGSVVGTVTRTLSARVSSLTTGRSGRVVPTVQPTVSPTPATATATVVPAAVVVQPASPQTAVQGYYDALNQALLARHNATSMARAYAYLTPAARLRLPFAAFQRQYAADTGLRWSWIDPTYAADHKSATVPVTLTEYRSGGNVSSTFAWVVVDDGANGWHLDHADTQVAGNPPAVAGTVLVPAGEPAGSANGNAGGNLNGHGRGNGHAKHGSAG